MNTLEQGRILVVDDDRHVRTVASLRLRASGYDVVEADNGATALERIRAGGIDLVLLDALMPGMNGFEVLEQMQKLTDRPGVLFCTAMNANDSRIRELYGDAVDVIEKPFVAVVFLARVADSFRKHRISRGTPASSHVEHAHRKHAPRHPPVADTAVMKRLIPGMLADMKTACLSMNEAQEKDDLETMTALGHQIKGTSGVFGFQELSDLGEAIENSAKALNRDESRRLVARLSLLLEGLIAR